MTFTRIAAVATAVVGLAAPAVLGAETPRAQAKPEGLTIRHLDTRLLSDDLEFGGQRVGGLSGIDYTQGGTSFLAISDNRGESGPVRAYTLNLPIGADGKLGEPEFDRLITLLDANGAPYAPRSVDPESVRWTPNHQGFLYTSEGEAKAGRAGFIREATLDGAYVRDLPVPDAFTPRLEGGQLVSGIRDNLGFEAMDLARGASTVVAVSENALVQDGPAASPEAESPSRLVQLHHATGAVVGEYVYPVDKVEPGGLPVATGIAEILAVDPGRYLTLERSMVPGTGFTARIYETSTDGADPISGAVSAATKPMSKRLLFDFRANGIDPQCVEGMTWGPKLSGGARSLVLVSDNNFGQAGRTAFHLLSVD
ncbi:esterase-like activity of phytase family protein [Nocardia sp. NPDC050406]|uniref:esterase-like activity of phytase family protein n=1 Tax=Nocardia sp. NPDC050406 TaxID=3364318 RepID=UPI0037B586F0